jgi:hypothetical protein
MAQEAKQPMTVKPKFGFNVVKIMSVTIYTCKVGIKTNRLFPHIKGVIQYTTKKGIYTFEYVTMDYDDHRNKATAIGKLLKEHALEKHNEKYKWTQEGYDPVEEYSKSSESKMEYVEM